jgi:hypothetical protein
MKPYLFSIIAAAAACGLAQAQTAYTTPVGYITATINGNTSSSSAGAATYVSASLVRPADFAGATSIAPSGTTFTFSGGVPTGLDGTSMLEITSGTNEGWWTTISGSSATSITVTDTVPGGLSANTTIVVRKFNTVSSLFGANSPGLTAFDGVTTAFDNIQILDPITQASKTIVYVTGVAPDGWYDFVSSNPADDEIIYPGTAVRVVHLGTTDLDLVSTGEVKITKTQVDVYPNENWLGQPLAAGGTLGSMEFKNQIVKFDGVAENDFLEIVRPDPGTGQPADLYVALIPDFGDVMANFVTTADATSEPIAEGVGYNLKRSPAGSASVITFPAQTIAP